MQLAKERPSPPAPSCQPGNAQTGPCTACCAAHTASQIPIAKSRTHARSVPCMSRKGRSRDCEEPHRLQTEINHPVPLHGDSLAWTADGTGRKQFSMLTEFLVKHFWEKKFINISINHLCFLFAPRILFLFTLPNRICYTDTESVSLLCTYLYRESCLKFSLHWI